MERICPIARQVAQLHANDLLLYFCSVVDYGNQYQFQLEFPNLRAEGSYDIDGRIVLVPVKGNGPFHGNFSKFLNFRGKKKLKSNGIYLFFL